MESADERARLAAHVLLDMISVQDFNARVSEQTETATRLAFSRLNEVEAVTATRDDESDVTTVESTALTVACGSLVALLMDQVQKQGYERDGSIVALRETVDELFGS